MKLNNVSQSFFFYIIVNTCKYALVGMNYSHGKILIYSILLVV